MILSNNVNLVNKKNDEYVFIVESIDTPIEATDSSSVQGAYEYTAVVAKFGIHNENGREYQRDDYLAQLPQLKDKIKKKALMGELDHPQNYDTSLKNVSHFITDVWYDSSDDCVKVKLKLVDTPYGRIAKTLIDAGVQLSISSRSAGKVDGNGIVSLFKIFTFDLVAEPGFAQAILQPSMPTQLKESFQNINESFSFSNENSVINKLELLYEGKMYGDNAKIYKVNENDVASFEKKLNQTQNNYNEMNGISREEFNEYSKRMASEFSKLRSLLEAKGDDDAQAQAQDAQAQAQGAQSQAQGAQAQAQDAQSQAQYAQSQAQGAQSQSQAQGAQSQAQGAQAQAQNAQSQAQNAQSQAQYAQSQAQGAQSQAQGAQGLFGAQSQPQAQAQPAFGAQAQPQAQMGFGSQAQPQPGFGAQAQPAGVPSGVDGGDVPNIQDTFNTVQNLIQYINFLAKQIEALMGHGEVVTEMLNRSINYSESIGKTLNKHIEYTNAQGKLLNEAIGYSQELAGIINENALVTEKTVSYMNLVGTRLNESIQLSNVIADKTQKAIEFTEYNAQLFNEHVDFTNMLAKEINGANFTNAKAEGVENRNLGSNVASIAESKDEVSAKVDKLLEKINSRSNESVLIQQYPFLGLLSESNKQEFYKLDNDTKAEVVATLNSGYYGNESDVMSTIHAVVENKNANIPNYLKLMPDKYKSIYESLTNEDKSEIARNAGSGFYRLNTPYQVKAFWDQQSMNERAQRIADNKKIEEIRNLNESKCQGTEGMITAQQFVDYERGYGEDFILQMTRHSQNH